MDGIPLASVVGMALMQGRKLPLRDFGSLQI